MQKYLSVYWEKNKPLVLKFLENTTLLLNVLQINGPNGMCVYTRKFIINTGLTQFGKLRNPSIWSWQTGVPDKLLIYTQPKSKGLRTRHVMV